MNVWQIVTIYLVTILYLQLLQSRHQNYVLKMLIVLFTTGFYKTEVFLHKWITDAV